MDGNNISSDNYKAYERAFDALNTELFDSILPSVVLTLRAGRNTHGYAWAKRFKLHDAEMVQLDVEYSGNHVNDEMEEDDDTVTLDGTVYDEIAINPATASRSPRDVLGTLLHEMVHVWQFNFGKPSRNGYHNAEWANKMLTVGLKPFNVKNPDSMTGQGCSHAIEIDGAADILFARLLADFGPDLVVELPTATTKKAVKNSKVKFTCPECGCNAWGKDTLRVRCDECDRLMESEG